MQHPHAIITGGSSGIGKAVAKQLAQQGYSLTLIARDQNKLTMAADEITKFFRSANQKVIIFNLYKTENTVYLFLRYDH